MLAYRRPGTDLYDLCLSASTADSRTVNEVMTHYSPSTRTANNVLRMPAHRAHAHGG